MTKSSVTMAEPVNGFFAGGSRHISDLVATIPSARRGGEAKTARARISAERPKPGKARARVKENPNAPTPERLAKGDVVLNNPLARHVASPLVERLAKQGKLDHDKVTARAMVAAAEKLYRHFVGCGVGVKAQDLNRIVGGSAEDLSQEEGWVHHRDVFRTACKMMGWSDTNPHRGAGRLVVEVVCFEQTVHEAALKHIGSGRTEAIKAAGMDRLREGLFALAVHWRFY